MVARITSGKFEFDCKHVGVFSTIEVLRSSHRLSAAPSSLMSCRVGPWRPSPRLWVLQGFPPHCSPYSVIISSSSNIARQSLTVLSRHGSDRGRTFAPHATPPEMSFDEKMLSSLEIDSSSDEEESEYSPELSELCKVQLGLMGTLLDQVGPSAPDSLISFAFTALSRYERSDSFIMVRSKGSEPGSLTTAPRFRSTSAPPSRSSPAPWSFAVYTTGHQRVGAPTGSQ